MQRVDPGSAAAVTETTEITVSGGDRYRVEGNPKDIERLILDAARGSIMELAWMIDADTGERVGVNPEHVVTLRAAGSESARPNA
jgi:hypothetical protein